MNACLPQRLLLAALALLLPTFARAEPDLIVHNGKIVTVDDNFSIQQALAIADGRIVQVGSNKEVLALAGDNTQRIDLEGKTVLPGLIDSHVHPSGASMHEFDHEIPEMTSIQDVLDYIESRTKVVPEGKGISIRQVFITRLREQRYPTKAELDAVAPKHPVVFSTGPDASVNSLALKQSGIDKDFKESGSARIERDPQTGEPTGILRSAGRYLKIDYADGKSASEEDRVARLMELFADYNSVGITGVIDRSTGGSAMDRCRALRDSKQLTVRFAGSWRIGTGGSLESIRKQLKDIADHELAQPDPMVRIIGVKTFLDGGMLTGSAYMREPWGVSKIYSITDPNYRGVVYVEPERLTEIVRATVEAKLQFTAHSVGDGAVHRLIDAYEEVNKDTPIRATRPCITHCNFMSREAVERMAKLGIVADIQPAWLYLDAWTLHKQFGDERTRYFQPLASCFEAGTIVGGGSDHMQKIGSLRSVNPYNPWLGMWTTITRRARWFEGQLHPEEALTREQAIRFYTINNAYIMFLDDQVGSLEQGKFADFIVLDRDVLSCEIDELRDTQVLATYLAGRRVHDANAARRSVP